MSVSAWSIYWFLLLLVQSTQSGPVQITVGLADTEKARLLREPKLDNRIKIYDAVNTRFDAALIGMLQRQELDSGPSLLKSWGDLLDQASVDIDSSPGRKEKSKALIRYEIHLRKSISAVQEAKIKATVEQSDAFESWLERAERIRKKYVAILFPK
jgi:hypothetical protein